MARKTNSTKSKRRQKSGRRKDYTRGTALALRSPEAMTLMCRQNVEIERSRVLDAEQVFQRRIAREEARVAKYGAQQ